MLEFGTGDCFKNGAGMNMNIPKRSNIHRVLRGFDNAEAMTKTMATELFEEEKK